MSRSLPKDTPQDESASQRPLAARSLTAALVERLTADIVGGKLAPGAKLPTEQEMTAAMGVSRTVVREAVASLRAEGLVITRQGVGAFVATDVQRRPFRIDPELRSIRQAIDVMELRTGIEIEAAGLAAERGSKADVRRIGEALAAMQQAIDGGDTAVDQDFAFHASIAAATGNPQFLRFLEYLGRFIIPRQNVRYTSISEGNQRTYLEKIQGEHAAIHRAIAERTVPDARNAMRRHLLNSRERYRKLAEAIGE